MADRFTYDVFLSHNSKDKRVKRNKPKIGIEIIEQVLSYSR